MKNYSKLLLASVLCVALFGAVACSDDSSSSAPSNDVKKNASIWKDVKMFDSKSDLPSCDKFDGIAVQVFDEKGFFTCFEGEWMPINVLVTEYEKLPKCEAAMNDFCVDVAGGKKIEASYICDEGKWVKGSKVEGSSLCMKTDKNSLEIEYNVSCKVVSTKLLGVRLGDQRVGRGEVLSEKANCRVLTFDDGRKRCGVEVNDYDCNGEWNDGTCGVEGLCMHVEKPCLTEFGIRLNCDWNENDEMECETEEYGGKRGHIENGVCVEN